MRKLEQRSLDDGSSGFQSRQIYLDSAAGSQMSKEVYDAKAPFELEYQGNSASPHQFGIIPKLEITRVRRNIATYLNVNEDEIYFTSGGSEGNSWGIQKTVDDLGVERIISSTIEHDSVLNTVKAQAKKGVVIDYVKLNQFGAVDYNHLEELLENSNKKTLVTLMHANNELGTMNDLDTISRLAANAGAIFHSDLVQTIGFHDFDLQATKMHLATGSSHKFHGPKGVGFVYVNSELTSDDLPSKLGPIIYGGSQERARRGGTHNVAGISGMGAALEFAVRDMEETRTHVSALKAYTIKRLVEEIPNVSFNGDITPEGGNYKVVSVLFPLGQPYDGLLKYLHTNGIAVSGGSACNPNEVSHVLTAVGASLKGTTVRISFSKYNTINDVDYLMEVLLRLK